MSKKNEQYKKDFSEKLLDTIVVSFLVLLGMGAVLFLHAAISQAEPLVKWDAVTTNIDGTPANNLQGYKLFVSQTQGNYESSQEFIIPPDVTEYVFADGVFTPGTYYTVAVAYSTEGVQSKFSNEISFVIKTAPKAPTNYRFRIEGEILIEEKSDGS